MNTHTVEFRATSPILLDYIINDIVAIAGKFPASGVKVSEQKVHKSLFSRTCKSVSRQVTFTAPNPWTLARLVRSADRVSHRVNAS